MGSLQILNAITAKIKLSKPKNELLLVQTKVGGRESKFLIDRGATHNFYLVALIVYTIAQNVKVNISSPAVCRRARHRRSSAVVSLNNLTAAPQPCLMQPNIASVILTEQQPTLVSHKDGGYLINAVWWCERRPILVWRRLNAAVAVPASSNLATLICPLWLLVGLECFRPQNRLRPGFRLGFCCWAGFGFVPCIWANNLYL
ncbi:hypothetical protein AKJ16_DCAP01882 [Drosera capensis]